MGSSLLFIQITSGQNNSTIVPQLLVQLMASPNTDLTQRTTLIADAPIRHRLCRLRLHFLLKMSPPMSPPI